MSTGACIQVQEGEPKGSEAQKTTAAYRAKVRINVPGREGTWRDPNGANN